ncbi:hypothetical protein L3Q82_018703, partial [Scortum barcoo]
MSFLRRVAGRSLRDRVRSSVTREELGVEPLLLRIERSQLRWLGHLFRMPPGRLPREVFQACPTGRRPRGRPRTRWRRLCLSAGLGTPRGPPGRAGGSVWGEGSLGISAQTAASATRSRTKRMKKKKKKEEVDGRGRGKSDYRQSTSIQQQRLKGMKQQALDCQPR